MRLIGPVSWMVASLLLYVFVPLLFCIYFSLCSAPWLIVRRSFLKDVHIMLWLLNQSRNIHRERREGELAVQLSWSDIWCPSTRRRALQYGGDGVSRLSEWLAFLRPKWRGREREARRALFCAGRGGSTLLGALCPTPGSAVPACGDRDPRKDEGLCRPALSPTGSLY